MSTAIIMEPDIQQKLAILGSEAAEEVTDVPATQSIQQGIQHATGFVYNAKQAGGGTTRLFKVLQTNACRYRCRYWSHLHLLPLPPADVPYQGQGDRLRQRTSCHPR